MKQLPPNAQRVFKGEIFEVWQWEQKVYDDSTKTFEAIKRPNTSEAVAIIDDKILVLQQEQPHKTTAFPSLPGGRCEDGEDPLDAAKRELLEESGYVSDNWSLFKIYTPVGKMIWDIYAYIAKDCKKIKEPEPDFGEKFISKFLTFEEFINLGEDPEFRDKELQIDLIKAKYNNEAKKSLHQRLFGD